MLRGTTLIHLSLTAQALTSAGCVHQKHPILRRGDGRSRRSLKGKSRSTAQLQDHVPQQFSTPFQQPGLSVASLAVYSSFRSLFSVQL